MRLNYSIIDLPQTPGVPLPPHVSPDGQLPQSSKPPQPSAAGPQNVSCSEQVKGTQPPVALQWLATHACPAGHAPQSTTAPQPSPMEPQLAPTEEQVRDVQEPAPHLFAT